MSFFKNYVFPLKKFAFRNNKGVFKALQNVVSSIRRKLDEGDFACNYNFSRY